MSTEKDLRTHLIPPADTLDFATYETLAEQAAFFRNDPDCEQQIATVQRYFLEETIEAIGEIHPSELIPVLWGLPKDQSEDAGAVKKEVRKELGDLLYMIKAGALIHGDSLGALALRGIQHFTGRTPAQPITTFRKFDDYMHGRCLTVWSPATNPIMWACRCSSHHPS